MAWNTLEPTADWVYSEVAVALAKARDSQGALRGIQRIRDIKKRPDVLLRIVDVQIQNGDFRDALNSAWRIGLASESENDKFEALLKIIEAYYQKSDVRAARKTSKRIFSKYNKSYYLSELVKIQAKFGDIKGVQHTVKAADTNNVYWKTEQFTRLATELSQQGRYSEAQHILESIPSAIQQSLFNLGFGEVSIDMVEQQLKKSKTETERKNLTAILKPLKESLKKVKEALSLYNRSFELQGKAIVQAWMGDFENASVTVQGMEEGKKKQSVIHKIATIQLEQGDVEGAKATLQTIGIEKFQLSDWLIIAEQQAKTGDHAGAQKTFVKAIADAASISSASAQVSAFKDIAMSQVRAGFAADALQMAERVTFDVEKHLPELAAVFAERKDCEHFKALLQPCSAYIDAAYKMCGHLARLYPEQAAGIAAVVRESGGHRG